MIRVAVGVAALVALGGLARGQEGGGGGEPVRAGTESDRSLVSPAEDDSFRFVIYGDRTGGPARGIEVLREAVAMTNHLDPAFVMTVGDLIQGYNDAPKWLKQARHYQRIMGGLRSPWYPVAGNHDVYARPRKPGGHTDLYKEHFGPLYYSFDYAWAHFVVLFTDEAGSFKKPEKNQNFSAEQLAWLKADLEATSAEQVFVFLHHPRWLPRYAGCNWPEAQRLFAEDGRVRAVFAGHIHQYRDDGARDGIHYYTLATVGAHKNERLPVAAFDHVNLVSVRRGRFTVSVIPVGGALGGDVVRGAELDDLRALVDGDWVGFDDAPRQAVERAEQSSFGVELTNPTDADLRLSLTLEAGDGWTLSHPPLSRIDLPARATKAVHVQARAVAVVEKLLQAPRVVVETRFSTAGGRSQAVRVVRRAPVELVGVEDWARAQEGPNRALILDGKSALRVDLPLDEEPALTLECWVRGEAPRGRSALLAKTESSSLGIFWSERSRQRPAGSVHLRGLGYRTAVAAEPWTWGRWTHVALVYDGAEARLYVDGQPAGVAAGVGRISANRQPLYVGADPDRKGQPKSFFRGAIDEVRLSRGVRYREAFSPPSRHTPDSDTLLLLPLDGHLGPVHPDLSGQGRHARAVGAPVLGPGRSWN